MVKEYRSKNRLIKNRADKFTAKFEFYKKAKPLTFKMQALLN